MAGEQRVRLKVSESVAILSSASESSKRCLDRQSLQGDSKWTPGMEIMLQGRAREQKRHAVLRGRADPLKKDTLNDAPKDDAVVS